MDLNELIERERIQNVIYRYCEAVDAKDWDKVMSSFTVDAKISHGYYSGSAETFLEFVQGILNKMTKTVHVAGGSLFRLMAIEPNSRRLSYPFTLFLANMNRLVQLIPVVSIRIGLLLGAIWIGW